MQGIEKCFAVWEHKTRCTNFLWDLTIKWLAQWMGSRGQTPVGVQGVESVEAPRFSYIYGPKQHFEAPFIFLMILLLFYFFCRPWFPPPASETCSCWLRSPVAMLQSVLPHGHWYHLQSAVVSSVSSVQRSSHDQHPQRTGLSQSNESKCKEFDI